MPSFEVFEAIEAGEIEIAIGGCCVTDDDPRFECRVCGQRFGGQPRRDSDPDSTRPKAEA